MGFEQDVVVTLEEGLHARPAARLAQLAKTFQCSIEIRRGGSAANAKSTVKIMLLTVKQGERIRVCAEGEDAEAALREIAAYLAGGQRAEADHPIEPAPAALVAPTPPAAPGVITGISGNEGVAVGPAFVYLPEHGLPERRVIAAAETGAERERFRDAVLQVCAMLDTARDEARDADGAETTQSRVFAAIKEIAQDVELLVPIEQRIARGQDAASATLDVGGDLADRFARIDDAYFRLRADDVRGVARRIAEILLGRRDVSLEELREPSILVAGELSALDFARLPGHLVTGLLTTEGGATSHVAIIARALGFPAVVGARALEAALRGTRRIALDGGAGIAILDPEPAIEQEFLQRMAEAAEVRRAMAQFTHIEPRTADGTLIEVAANIGAAGEVEAALQSGAMGVGLLRTEFMFMRGAALPTEEEQFRIYSRVLAAFAPRPVLIRTLDIGGDKPLPGVKCEPEANPFLGWRGIRMCLDAPDLFEPQLRALLRASVHGRLRVMFPMISDVAEVRAAKERLRACREALHAQGMATGAIELGIMIETPAAALCARELAEQVAFFSIGTNDLTQYTMAADRTNARLQHLSRADHPAVLRMIEMACAGAREAGIWIGVCGEAAGDPAMIPRLLSWGVTELSMSPALIPRAKKTVTEYGRGSAAA